MQARHTARRLALMTMYQSDRLEQPIMPNSDYAQHMVDVVRALTDLAREQLETHAVPLSQAYAWLAEQEAMSPENLASPIGRAAQPIALPNTRETMAHLEGCVRAAEGLMEALHLPELLALSQCQDVKQHAVLLLKTVADHTARIDEILQSALTDWRLDRLSRLDRCVLRLAVAELCYGASLNHDETTDHSVIINEAVELAKHYAGSESASFVNGVLGGVVAGLAVVNES